MSQYCVHKNMNDNSKKIYPYLLDVQSPLLDTLETRLVIPVARKSSFTKSILNRINPVIKIDNIDYLVLTQQMAAIHGKSIGDIIEHVSIDRNEILSAIDFIITGY